MVEFAKDSDTPLLRVSRNDIFRLSDAYTGVHAFGGIGSGKTSGSGRMLAGAYLRAGMGGVVTVAKPEDSDMWRHYLTAHGRIPSLIVFDENEGFNFLDYEMSRQGLAGIGTVVGCLMRVLEAAKRASPTASQQGGDAFWAETTEQILRYTLPALYSANGRLTIPEIVRFLNTAPTKAKDVIDREWQDHSFMYQVMNTASRRPIVPMTKEALLDALNFWSEAYIAIPDRTRGNIVISATAALDRFKHGRLNRVFCGRTTLVPELTFHGAVIVLAMPTLTWNEDGIIAQMLFKYMWQRAVLGRNSLAQEHRERPVFLWSDEAQETVSSYDAQYQSLCRGMKACTVFLTQSLPTYYAKMGGDNPRDDANALVGKFITHIYHSNACPETNEYASRVIGKVLTRRENYSNGNSTSVNLGMSAGDNENWSSSSSYGASSGNQSHSANSSSGSTSGSGHNWGENRGRGTSRNESRGYSEAMEYAIEPGDFGRYLLTGGTQNRQRVTGIWFQAGRTFSTGTNYLLGRFAQ